MATEGLRVRAARGTIVSAAFLVGLNLLSLARGFVVAGFLTLDDYGAWGVLLAILGAVLWLKDVGIADRFVQQEEDDQAAAFQTAYTLQLIVSAVLALVMGAVIPLYALLIGEGGIVAPGLALAAALPAMALQAPIWVHYREMDYVRQRTLQAVDPVVGFVVTVALAVAGLGLWALVVGTLAGAYLSAAAATASSPYPLRLRLSRLAVRDYAGYSWPLVLASGSAVLIAQATVITSDAVIGLAGVGAIALANNVTRYTSQVDGIVTNTLYPAICRVRDRRDLLFESFVKSNRIALMWGVPFGVAVTLFASDLVHHLIGSQWEPAVTLLEALGIGTALAQVGFNWTAYYRALGETRPFAVASGVVCAAFLVSCVPLLIAFGLDGLAAGTVVLAIAQLWTRVHYIHRLFPRFSILRQGTRAAAPVLPAVAAVLLVRLAAGDGRGGAEALGELALYGVVVAVATALLERRLLAEVLGYVRGRRPAVVA